METQFTKFAFRTLLVVMGSIAVACGVAQSPPDPALDQSTTERLERSPDLKEIELPGGGRGRIKAGGWPTPELTSAEVVDARFKVQGAKTFDGTEVDVEATRYRTVFGEMRLPTDMAAELGDGSHLNVQGVSEYKAKDRIFAYMFVVNPIEVDRASNKITRSRGFVFYFVLYDEDDDGKFETLASNEPSVTKRLRPHVPAWAAK